MEGFWKDLWNSLLAQLQKQLTAANGLSVAAVLLTVIFLKSWLWILLVLALCTGGQAAWYKWLRGFLFPSSAITEPPQTTKSPDTTAATWPLTTEPTLQSTAPPTTAATTLTPAPVVILPTLPPVARVRIVSAENIALAYRTTDEQYTFGSAVSPTDATQVWIWDKITKQISHEATGMCLSLGAAGARPIMSTCNPSDARQQWNYNATSKQLTSVGGSNLSVKSWPIGWTASLNDPTQQITMLLV